MFVGDNGKWEMVFQSNDFSFCCCAANSFAPVFAIGGLNGTLLVVGISFT